MFKEINGKVYNMFYIQSITKNDTTETVEGAEKTSYNVVYEVINGNKITESFDDAASRDARYDEMMGITI